MRPGASYYLLTSLPMLAEPGTPPPVSPAELHARAAGSAAAALVDVVLLSDDLRQRQALRTGEVTGAEAAVLTPEQMAGEAPLPAFLLPEEPAEAPRLPDDVVQEAYWRHAARTARRSGSHFLTGWVRTEVALRNGLAAARARTLSRPFEGQEVAPELAGAGGITAADGAVESALAAWAAAADPLAGLRSLLLARWAWATGAEPRFTFARDEVAAYAVKLLLLRDWRRIMGTTGVAA